MSIFLYYLLEVYFILIDILYKLHPLLVGQLTHEKILICLIFSHFQLYLHKLPYFEMHTDHVNSTLTSSTRVYSFVPLFSSFSQYFTVPLFLLDSSHSNRIQWNPVESSGMELDSREFHRIAD